ncbi:enoyl-CoA hydratase [Ectothiorhodospira lacustris]|uniref:enoyl-CoA hydratase n=1 Tax=Ectothiorhodospira lacustris TaxID=2899127 RepID=UPI001EE8D79A|nr:enoyl-CoA hydratase [Ectothiorhodospira lacustris]MCG5501340.1 enoyl-CoA hydratase [Ectothiorhodospira lacustris]
MTAVTQATPSLLMHQEGEGVVYLTLNRPRSRNSLSLDLIEQLHQQLNDLAVDDTVKVVVLAGVGPAFSAGHDLKEIQAGTQSLHETLFNRCSEMMLTLKSLPMPVIAQVHGMASAAGCQLVASCDLAVAGRSAQFAAPGVNIGLFCSTPMVPLSRAVQPKHALHMLLTGAPIDADTAWRKGLVSQVVDDEALADTVLRLARSIAGKSASSIRIGKAAFYEQLDLPEREAYALAARVMTGNLRQPDAQEGISAFLEKRAPIWR